MLEARPAGEGWESDAAGWTSPGWRGVKEQRWNELGARLAPRADGVLDVGVSQFRTMRVRLAPQGAEPVQGKVERGHLVYEGAYGPDVDLVMTTGRTSVEALFVLHERADQAAFSWRVELASGVARGREEASGAVAFLDPRGQRVLTVPAAYAVDARGEKRPARLSWDETSRTLRVALDARGLTFPVLLDPSFETAVWEQLNPAHAPDIRMPHAAMVYDEVHKNVVLFGGYTANGDLNDTWTWDGTDWTQQDPPNSPASRDGHAMVWDGARGKVVMFGGVLDDQATFLNDTWTWDGTTWTDVSPPVNQRPPPRESMAMAYDAVHGKVLMFGGWGGGPGDWRSWNDTWLWDGTTWTDAAPAAAPSLRDSGAMAFDPVRGFIVHFGGSYAVAMDDTWKWTGTTWVQLSPAKAPGGRDSNAMAFDPFSGKLILFGGIYNDTWSWDGTTWASVSSPSDPAPLARRDPAMAFDAARGQIVMFGGHGGGNGLLNDTWVFHARGGSCTNGSDCATGHCVDGVCCERASCGACEACNLATPGICSPVTGAPDPDTCSGAHSCDGTGTCKANLGEPCSKGNECASGSCVDGVCCSSPACGPCEACAANLKVSGPSGTCDAVKAGVDPHNDCPDDGALSCQRNGQCDGKGGCALYAPGTSCGASVCSQNRATGRLCDGFGTCGANATGIDCAPYVCDPALGACANPCTRDDQCVLGDFCDAGTCRPRLPYGSPCTSAAACPVGAFCADGVCCNTPCHGQCEACDSADAPGTCIPVLGPPHGARSACAGAAPESPCAQATCDGVEHLSCNGFVGPAVQCRSQSCTNGVETLPASCDGKGNCPSVVTKACAPYACGADACKTSCSTDSDCARGNRCDTATSKCVSGATCSDRHTLVDVGGKATDCAPYICQGQACHTTCASVQDCVFPAECDQSGHCVTVSTDTDLGGGTTDGGCSVGPTPSARSGSAAAFGALLALALRQRRRQRRGAGAVIEQSVSSSDPS